MPRCTNTGCPRILRLKPILRNAPSVEAVPCAKPLASEPPFTSHPAQGFKEKDATKERGPAAWILSEFDL